jgi:hypothetical protein
MSSELHQHVDRCAACQEVRQVADAFLQDASILTARYKAPDGSLLWRRAQAKTRETALERALRPFVLMRWVGSVYALALGLWCAYRFLQTEHRLSLQSVLGQSVLSGLASQTMIAGALIALTCISMGAWYLLRQDSRDSFMGVHSNLR